MTISANPIKSWQTRPLFNGEAEGEVLRFDAPISFWGGVNPETAEVSLAGHPQQGEVITNKIVVIPSLIGSSSSSAVILELYYRNIAPTALILGEIDAILPIGVLVASQMGWSTAPIVMLENPPFVSRTKIRISLAGLLTILS